MTIHIRELNISVESTPLTADGLAEQAPATGDASEHGREVLAVLQRELAMRNALERFHNRNKW
jgi:hypothetical protein